MATTLSLKTRTILILVLAGLIALSPLFMCSPAHAQSQLETKPRIQTKKLERFEIRPGLSYPFTWNASLQLTIQEDGVRLGVYAIGQPWSRFSGADNTRSTITKYGISFGWAIVRWHSKWKGSGFDFTFGSGTDPKNQLKMYYTVGYVLKIMRTIYHEPTFAITAFISPKLMSETFNREKRGLAWDASGSMYARSIDAGLTYVF